MNVQAKNVDTEKCLKASFILKSKGSTLTEAIRDMIDQLAKEFDEKKGE